MPQRHITTKIAEKLKNSEQRASKYKEKNAALNKALRRSRQRHQETSASRDVWKARYKALRAEQAVLIRPDYTLKQEVKLSEGVSGHTYSRQIMSLSISLYALCGCSLRGVIRVLMCLQLELGLKSEDIPSKSSVQNWVQKLGYYTYTHYDKTTYEGGYSLIVDECMVIGQQRMVVVLGLPSEKTEKQATKLGDVRVLSIAVKSSWNNAQIKDLLEKVTEKMGKNPDYVISDGASNLKKGIQAANLVRLSDIGHEIGKFLEQTYRKNEAYNAFTKAAALVKFKEVMKDTSYLLPPKQRTIARFMNMSGTVNWAMKMLNAFDNLKPDEQQTFAWLKSYKNLIIDLDNTFNLAHLIMKIIKNKGLSYQNIEQCLNLTRQFTTKVAPSIIAKIVNYFEVEKQKLPNSETIWHASSDVIESLFGKYKSTVASNKLNGITPHVLSLCVFTHFEGQKELIHDTLRAALSNVSMAHLENWKHSYLIENQIVRRRNTLNI
jgi:transposase-like protein